MTSKPFRSYIICTAPRSGSTLLCGLLAATNAAGNPDSHFHSLSLDDWLDDYCLKHIDYASQEEAVRAIFKAALSRGKGDTDIFGLRMQRGSFDHFMQQLKLLLPGRMSDVERIRKAFGPTLYIHLSRPDRLNQAISRVRAEQTGLWHRNSDGTELERLAPPQEPRYDAAAIKRHMIALEALDEAWERWFELEAMEPMRINYDALSIDPKQVLAQVLSALNLDPSRAQSVEAPTAKLADELSREWRDRFESES
ncbi:Stf0 family sulfotransferase [Qingshengfaniella alkalisoli]|uniref:Sulfotransferase n=1 Tax=Qingshengfaniella alkalisoli TaxID=2599296 RepID=A0A5B8I938_9RHOB|nr:Stf0 family sulfotransferase [Qingshengfaniella alkalisoli]QDY69406.1 sulfotransferase [Qingshengfaniella alkalisoli]